MTTQEQARKVAEFLGWRENTSAAAVLRPWISPRGNTFSWLPNYETSLDACAEFEAEIQRRGWEPMYESCLKFVWVRDRGHDPLMEWTHFLITAAAAQRLAACVRVIEQMEGKDA